MVGETLLRFSAPRCSTRRAAPTVALLATAAVLGACGSATAATGATGQPDPSTVNLGYLVNLTHAPALIGVSQGFFQGAMPRSTAVKTTTFSAGPADSAARRRAW